jgi:very-short-patch-repair endonuclease
MERQKCIGVYRVDLYIQEHYLVVECDENGHSDRDPSKEKEKDNFLTRIGCTVLRFNPNIKNFDLSTVLNAINVIILTGKPTNTVVRMY